MRLLLLAAAALAALPAAAAPAIDTAQESGVAGFPIGIFGTGFGATQGTSTVTILGAPATILMWSDTAIQAVVPQVADGTGTLTVNAGGAASSPFVVYSIDPNFLAPPTRLENLILKKAVVVTGAYSDYSRNGSHAPAFLAYNSGDGAAVLTPPNSIAMPLGQPISETVWFSFFGNSGGYSNETSQSRAPVVSYTIDASADSTDGINGTWTTVLSVTDNDRWSRTHAVQLTGQSWLRWNLIAVAGGYANTQVMEIRAYRVKPGSFGNRYDSWAVIGDSITADDLNHAGDLSFWGQVMSARNDGTEPLPLVAGFSGSKTALLAGPELPAMLAREPDIRYFGIALGINDYGYADASTTAATDLANLETGIQALLAAGRVPLLIRIADTIDSETVPPTSPAMKKLILANEDRLSARYRLIPGPDFYTTFRLHPERIRGDGIHHLSGDLTEMTMWGQSMLRSGLYRPISRTVTPSAPTNLRTR
jgi:hypothetical protein